MKRIAIKVFSVILALGIFFGTTSLTLTEENVDAKYTNLSWMKDIKPEIGAFHISIKYDTATYNKILTDERLKYFNTFVIEADNYETAIYEMKRFKAANKKVWLMTYYLLSPEGWGKFQMYGDWRKRVDKYAKACLEILGDNFEGFYFDEPFHHMTNEQFIIVTKYLRTTYKRRLFAIHPAVSYAYPSWSGKDLLTYKRKNDDPYLMTIENQKYLTDVGYFQYQTWNNTASMSGTLFKRALKLCNPDVRVWICPMLGTFDWTQDENDNLTIIKNMFNQNANNPNFGGIFFYTMLSSPVVLAEGDPRLHGDKVIINNKTQLKEQKRYIEGGGSYYTVMPNENGDLRWKKVASAMDLLGNGFMKNKSMLEINSELQKIN